MNSEQFSTKTKKASLVRDVEAIALPEGRRVGTKGHAKEPPHFMLESMGSQRFYHGFLLSLGL